MSNKEKKGIFGRIFGSSSKKNCCSFEVEEIAKTENKTEEQDKEKRKQKRIPSTGSCCG